MIKNISTLLVLLLTLFSFSQNAILIQNKNPKAKELKHSLNSTKDSLLLYSESKILQFEIFNENYEETFEVNAYYKVISLNEIPAGNYLVEVKLSDKIILIDLIKRHENKEIATSKSSLKKINEGKGMMLDENLNPITSSPHQSIESILTQANANETGL
ncbi:hypothetical protein [Winogradskyella wichelsiae]|uniref:hypothetical protein n=1 Tax=Winogradskyella wichelsiae TaxID=2697007 RepID=UPI0015CBD034|nr:hypothetical protein [Winogradskyella wichelsiae]